MTTDSLKTLFQFTHGTVQQNTAGLTHDDSLVQPQPAGNCLNWVLGHITASRNDLFRLLGEEAPAWADPRARRYVRGSAPLTGGAEAVPFGEILAAYGASQDRLLAAFDRIPPETLATPLPDGVKVPGDPKTLGGALSILHFHETYHAGQVALLRRLAGKEGAIK